MPLVLGALAFFAIAYRLYYSFIAARVLTLSDQRVMPSSSKYDGQNYVPMSKWVLFGHHFAAIAGAGPLVGPVLAAQFGYFPGFLWMLIGAVFAGAVHDIVILTASVRRDGKSLAEIAKAEINKASGGIASIAILIIIVIAMAGLGLVVVNALAESAWGTFTIASTIPIAVLMGFWMFRFRKGKTVEATIIGVILLTLAVVYGREVAESSVASWFLFSPKTLTLLLAAYGFLASVLPVWVLLSPRDYLSSIMKIAVIGMLAAGVIYVAPNMQMPAFTPFASGGGPIIPGTLFPYLFITIACGAISGFHSLVSSGTTPKMIMKESHIKPIASGAMLVEGMVSILALVAACSLFPLDYFQINVSAEKFAQIAPMLKDMGFTQTNLSELSAEVGEKVAGRPGGAVSLAVGMAQIFSSIPGLKHLLSYWYHFAIMFEAVFILTAVDTGTRVGRYLLQEMIGLVIPKFLEKKWVPGIVLTSFLFTLAWGYLVYTGDITTIWPLFGMSNQLLATCGLIIGTTMILRMGTPKYALITAIPGLFMVPVTMSAGYLNIVNNFMPKGMMLLTVLSIVLMILMSIVFVEAFRTWYRLLANPSSEPTEEELEERFNAVTS